MNNIAVFGIYSDHTKVSEAIDALKAAGFRSTDISILYPDKLGSGEFGHEKHSKAPEGAVAGGGSGAVVGAAIGWLAGAGALMVPGLESLTAAGPIMGMLSGMGAGVTLGGLAGAAAGAGLPEYEARRYGGRLNKGGILVSVHCDTEEWSRSARSILRQTGGHDVSTAGEAKADFAATLRPMERGRISSSLSR